MEGQVIQSCKPLAIQEVKYRVSFYADDDVLFSRPSLVDLQTIKSLKAPIAGDSRLLYRLRSV